jgi:hypothetical protein
VHSISSLHFFYALVPNNGLYDAVCVDLRSTISLVLSGLWSRRKIYRLALGNSAKIYVLGESERLAYYKHYLRLIEYLGCAI